MLLGANAINIGEYLIALKAYTCAEQECLESFSEPELNLKLASIYLNLGITYIHMTNYNIAEKYIKKGLTQSEGMLGNEIIYKLNADLNENMGVVNEFNMRPKEAINFYKKSLKAKFGLYGENHEEVLDLQYKISSVYITLKQYKEACEIMTAMTEVILKEKINENRIDYFPRYGVYFYTAGMLLIKLNKHSIAKDYLNNAVIMWKDYVNPDDPALNLVFSLIKICEKKK